MTPDRLAELEKKLAAHGLTVLLTRDYDAILAQLARLAQFERLALAAEKNDPLEYFEVVMAEIRTEMNAAPHVPYFSEVQPLEVVDIPKIMKTVHTGLQSILDQGGSIRPWNLRAATTAFTALLGADPKADA